MPIASIVRMVSIFFNIGNLQNIFSDLLNQVGIDRRYAIRDRMDEIVVFPSLDHRGINQ